MCSSVAEPVHADDEDDDDLDLDAQTNKVILLPIQLMLKPFNIRFRYHFYGNKPTNNLQKVFFLATLYCFDCNLLFFP